MNLSFPGNTGSGLTTSSLALVPVTGTLALLRSAASGLTRTAPRRAARAGLPLLSYWSELRTVSGSHCLPEGFCRPRPVPASHVAVGHPKPGFPPSHSVSISPRVSRRFFASVCPGADPQVRFSLGACIIPFSPFSGPQGGTDWLALACLPCVASSEAFLPPRLLLLLLSSLARVPRSPSAFTVRFFVDSCLRLCFYSIETTVPTFSPLCSEIASHNLHLFRDHIFMMRNMCVFVCLFLPIIILLMLCLSSLSLHILIRSYAGSILIIFLWRGVSFSQPGRFPLELPQRQAGSSEYAVCACDFLLSSPSFALTTK